MIAPALEALDILRTRTLASLAGEAIERLIVDGELKAGEHLNELALAARLGISRGPIREAIRGLERGGLVVTVVNQGSFVRRISADEAHELYEVRIALTGYACAYLAQHATPAQVKTLRDKLKRMSAAHAAGDAGDYYTGNVDFHAALMAFAGNRRSVRICEELGQELNLFRRRSLVSPEGMKASNAEHAEIVRAIAAGDIARARDAGEAHIRRGMDRFEASTPRPEPEAMRKSGERTAKG